MCNNVNRWLSLTLHSMHHLLSILAVSGRLPILSPDQVVPVVACQVLLDACTTHTTCRKPSQSTGEARPLSQRSWHHCKEEGILRKEPLPQVCAWPNYQTTCALPSCSLYINPHHRCKNTPVHTCMHACWRPPTHNTKTRNQLLHPCAHLAGPTPSSAASPSGGSWPSQPPPAEMLTGACQPTTPNSRAGGKRVCVSMS